MFPNENRRIFFFSLLNRLVVLSLGLLFSKCTRNYDLSSAVDIFNKWDSVFFTGIARNGYQFEHELAFYPGFPMIVRLLTVIIRIPEYFSGVLASSAFYCGAALVLYRLTRCVGFSDDFSKRVIFFWTFSPISIFQFAPYTESCFSFFSFLGMFLWIKRKSFLAMISFSVASFVRSNGLVLAGFFLYSALQGCLAMSAKQGIYSDFIESVFRLIIRFDFSIIKNIFFAMCCIVPSILFGFYANMLFCPGQEWCGSSPYSYVQDKYWNVGFLKYWRIRQIPNFLLAFPMIFFVFHYLFSLRKNKNINLIPFAFHLLALTTFSILCAHIQVTTRLVLAASPMSWWALAAYPGKLSSVFCVSYMVVGIGLFVNFLPWT